MRRARTAAIVPLAAAVIFSVWALTGGLRADVLAVPSIDGDQGFDAVYTELRNSDESLCEIVADSFVLGRPISHGYSAERPVSRAALSEVFDEYGFSAGDFERVTYTRDRMELTSLDSLSGPALGGVAAPKAAQLEIRLAQGARGGPRWEVYSMRAVIPCDISVTE